MHATAPGNNIKVLAEANADRWPRDTEAAYGVAEQLQRKLTAIFYADAVGYSRLTGLDEEATHRHLTFRLDSIAGAITSCGGSVMHVAGDAVLADFASIVGAVRCATNIQQTFKKDDTTLPHQGALQFRIGIHLGDVIVDRNEIYGDDVNIAVRLEQLSDPGGICISGLAYDIVRHKLPLHYEFMGKQRVKNISQPLRAFRVCLHLPPRSPSAERTKHCHLYAVRRGEVLTSRQPLEAASTAF